MTDARVRANVGMRAGIVCIVCNTILCAGKMFVGVVSGSVSIIADAVNNLSDAASNIISLVGFKLSSKPADKGHPYGHGRYEYLAALAVAVLILAIGLNLLKSSVEKIITPQVVEFSAAFVVVLGLSIVVKIWMMYFNKSCGELINSTTLIATASDSRNDVITTSAVLIAAIISEAAGINLDGWMGAAVALFILWSGFNLVRETLDPVLGAPPSDELVEAIETVARAHSEVLGMHGLAIHDYGPSQRFASIHIEVPRAMGLHQAHDIANKIESEILEKTGIELVVHLDPVAEQGSTEEHMKNKTMHIIKTEVDPRITIHDFDLIEDETPQSIFFECDVPFELDEPEDQLTKRIMELMRSAFSDYAISFKINRM